MLYLVAPYGLVQPRTASLGFVWPHMTRRGRSLAEGASLAIIGNPITLVKGPTCPGIGTERLFFIVRPPTNKHPLRSEGGGGVGPILPPSLPYSLRKEVEQTDKLNDRSRSLSRSFPILYSLRKGVEQTVKLNDRS